MLELKGYLDAHTAPKLEEAFQGLLKNQRFNIIVNCKDLSYISSAGLGVFMAYIEDVRKNKGDIKLSNMSTKVYNVFDLLGFPLLYEITPDEQDAYNKFGNRPDAEVKSRTLHIESRTERLIAVRDFVSDAAREFGFADEDVNKIALAVDEACTNVIKHAYRFAPDRDIAVTVRPHNAAFEVAIRDTGIGFDPLGCACPGYAGLFLAFPQGRTGCLSHEAPDGQGRI